MGRIIKGIIGICAIVSVGFGIKHQQKKVFLSDLTMVNVEALATNETVKLPCDYDENARCEVTFQLESGQTSTQKIPQSKNI